MTINCESNSLLGLINFLYAQNMDGKMIDTSFCAAETENEIDIALIRIPATSPAQMRHMCKGADHVLCLPTGEVTYIGALYTDVSKFPVARFYHLRERDLSVAARLRHDLIEEGHSVKTPRPEEFTRMIREDGWQRRVVEYRVRRAKRKADYEMVRSGREKNTTLAEAFFLNSTGCIICNSPAVGIASMTTAAVGGDSSMFAVRLCAEHQEERQNMDAPLANYLATKFDLPVAIETEDRTQHELLDDAEKIITIKLSMVVFKRDEKTIHARRRNGLTLIYRHTNGLDYGYMINSYSPKKVELVRIDSADHHPVPVGPDHIHPDIQNKFPPESSFTTGDIAVDWPLIARIMDEWEKLVCPEGKITSE